jgi:Plasma-membrane choline transporter
MMKSRGIDAIVNNLLIDNVLTMGSVFVALMTALLSYLYLKYTHPAYNALGAFYIPIVAFGFLVLRSTNGTALGIINLIKGKYCCRFYQKWCCNTIRSDSRRSSDCRREFSNFV